MQFKNKKELVQKTQTALNLKADGIAGVITWNSIAKQISSKNHVTIQFKKIDQLIKFVQSKLDLKVDGLDGSVTWNAIVKNIVAPHDTIEPTTELVLNHPLSTASYKLIMDHEVGGGQKYYDSALTKPCYPGGASGVTIGIGYDLGYNSSSQYETDWKHLLPSITYSRLHATLGLKRNAAKAAIPSLRDINISWSSAIEVFDTNTLPRFIAETLKAFPGADALHPDAFGALVSLVFNRGASVTGKNREEMRNIRNLISSKNYTAIANEINAMKRIWVGKGLDGLLRRRSEEAALVQSCS
jgi:hypothetical protein